jgi:hypothetical protein
MGLVSSTVSGVSFLDLLGRGLSSPGDLVDVTSAELILNSCSIEANAKVVIGIANANGTVIEPLSTS